MIYKRKDSPFWWTAFYDGEGHRVRISTKKKDKRVAEREAARLQLFCKPHKKPKTALEKIKERYLRFCLSNKSKTTYRLERITLDRFCQWAGNRRLDPLLVEEYKEHRLLSVSKRTINREYDVIRALFNVTITWGLIEENPCLKVPKYKIKADRKAPNYFTKQEVNLILYKSKGYLRDLILLDVNTGLRQSELVYLEWKDINFDTWSLTVQAKDELNWQPKSGKMRVVPIPDPCTKMLLERRARTLSKFVFPNQFGLPRLNNLNRGLRTFLEKIGLYKRGVGWHTFRHTYASHLAMKGVSLDTIAELLGHEDSRTTKIYAHLSPSHLKEMTDRLDFGIKKKAGEAVTKFKKRDKKM